MPRIFSVALLGLAILRVAVASPTGEWPEFRGPTGQGISTAAGLPVEWSATTNIGWKQTLPGAGGSSPVVSAGKVFLTAAIPGEAGNPALNCLCLDAATGRIEWRTELYGPGESPPSRAHDRNSPASPTPILDGERIYVYFGHYGAACLDRAGKVVWRNPRLRFDPVAGGGGSPVLADDRLVFVAECATAPGIVALDQLTGQTVWKAPRALPPKMKFSFGTPLVIEAAGRKQIVIPGTGAVVALDPKDGGEIWRVRYARDSSVSPRPVFANGLVYVSAGYLRVELFAIRPDGVGDVTDTHVAWHVTRGAPHTPGMLAVGEELYAVNDAGLATCWEAKTGTVVWQQRLPGAYSAAPVAAEGRIYFLNEDGLTSVVKAGREFAVLASNSLAEMTLASAAAVDGAMYVRTATSLFRIGAKAVAKP